MADSAVFFRAANIRALDYPYAAAIESALRIVDEACVVVGQSEDSTHRSIRRLVEMHPGRIKVREERFVFDLGWQERWWNWCREMTDADWHLWLDLDEVIHEDDAPAIRDLMQRPSLKLISFPFVHLYGTPQWREQGVFLTHNTRLGRASAGYRMRNWRSAERPQAAACAAVVQYYGREVNAHTYKGRAIEHSDAPIMHYGWARSAMALARSQAKQFAWYADGGRLKDGRMPQVEPRDFEMATHRASGRIVPYDGPHDPGLAHWFGAHAAEWAVREAEASQ